MPASAAATSAGCSATRQQNTRVAQGCCRPPRRERATPPRGRTSSSVAPPPKRFRASGAGGGGHAEASRRGEDCREARDASFCGRMARRPAAERRGARYGPAAPAPRVRPGAEEDARGFLRTTREGLTCRCLDARSEARIDAWVASVTVVCTRSRRCRPCARRRRRRCACRPSRPVARPFAARRTPRSPGAQPPGGSDNAAGASQRRWGSRAPRRRRKSKSGHVETGRDARAAHTRAVMRHP